MPIIKPSQYSIKKGSLIIELNSPTPDTTTVYLLSGAYITVYAPNLITYASDFNYRTWHLQAYPTHFDTSDEYYIHAKLTRYASFPIATIVYLSEKRNVDGSILGKVENNPTDPDYFYVYLGHISSSYDDEQQKQVDRIWLEYFEYGLLDTNKGKNESDSESYLSRLKDDTALGNITFLQNISVQGTAEVGKLKLNGNEIKNVSLSGNDNEEIPADDISLPTTKKVDEERLSKTKADTAQELITFNKGIKTGDYNESFAGAAMVKKEEGWLIETDNLYVRKKATFNAVEIKDLHHIGGSAMLTAASCRAEYVIRHGDNDQDGSCFYVFFRAKDAEGREITNDWMVGDQAYCNSFNLAPDGSGMSSNQYYWRVVLGKGTGEEGLPGTLNLSIFPKNEAGESTIGDYHWISLANYRPTVLYDAGSNAPRQDDNIVLWGLTVDRTILPLPDTDRDGAVMLSGAGVGSPYIVEFEGVYGFDSPEPKVRIQPGNNYFSGKVKIEASSEIEKPDGGSSTIGGIVEDLDEIKQQTDKRFEMWYNVGEPLPQKERMDEANSPADEWLDEATKALHVRDLYFDINIEPASSKGGRAWRWIAEKTDSGNIYYWSEVTDQDTIDALDKIRDVASDGVLTGGSEKGRVLIDWLDAVSSHAKYMEQAGDYTDEDSTVKDSKEAFNAAFFSLATMLNDGNDYEIENGVYTVPLWLQNISTSNVIADPEDYRAKWNNFYSTLTTLLQAISRITGEKAQQAEKDASEAKNKVDDIVSDNKLDPSEKQTILKDFQASWDEMTAVGGILDEAKDEEENYIINREEYIDPYIAAFEKLGNYLDGYDKDDDGGDWKHDNDSKPLPLWLQNLTTTNDINGEKFRGLWSEFYQRRTAVLTALSNLANDTANEALENSKGSVKVFVTDSTSEMPKPPYRKGDLWLAGKEEYYCINAKGEEESASMSDWAKLNVSVEEVFSSFVKIWYNKYGGTLDKLDINGFYNVHLLINAEESVDAYNGDLIYYSESDSLYYYNGVSYIEVTDGLRNSVGDIFKLVGSMTFRIFADRPNFAVTPDMFDLLIDVNRISYAGVNVTGGFGAYMYMSSGWTLLFEQSKAFFQALSDSIVGIVSGINSQSGVVIKDDFATLFAESLQDEGVKAEVVASITDENGVLSSDISISADQVNLTGNDSISMMVKNTAESNWLMYPLGVTTMESGEGSRTREVVFDNTYGNVLQITSTDGMHWQAYSPIKDYASYPLSGTKVTVYAVINTDGTPNFNVGIHSNDKLMFDISDYEDLDGNWRLYHKVVTLANNDTLAGIANLVGTIKVYALGVVVGEKTPTIDEIKVQVTEAANLYLTGIDITKGLINLRADRVKFSSSDGSVTDKVWIDPAEGTIQASGGVIGGFHIGQWSYNASGDIVQDVHAPYAFYTGNPDNDRTNYSYLTTAAFRLNQWEGYEDSGTGNLKVSLGTGSNPDGGDSCSMGLYIKRSSSDYKDIGYTPAAMIESDNPAASDIALRLKGGLQVHGGVIEKGYFLTIDANGYGVNVIDLSIGTTVVLNNQAATALNFYLPTLSQVRKQLGVSDSEVFAVPVTVIASVRCVSNAYIATQDKANNGTSADEAGQILSNNGEVYQGSQIAMGKGDVMHCALIYDRTGYYIQITGLHS